MPCLLGVWVRGTVFCVPCCLKVLWHSLYKPRPRNARSPEFTALSFISSGLQNSLHYHLSPPTVSLSRGQWRCTFWLRRDQWRCALCLRRDMWRCTLSLSRDLWRCTLYRVSEKRCMKGHPVSEMRCVKVQPLFEKRSVKVQLYLRRYLWRCTAT